MNTANVLDYGRKRCRWLPSWRAVLIVVFVICAGVAWNYRGEIARRSKLLLAQHRCIKPSAPADQIVFDSDPVRGAELASRDPSYICQPDGTFRTNEAWRKFSAILAPATKPIAYSPLGRLYTIDPDPKSPNVVLFLHERRAAPRLEPRLVTIELENLYITTTVTRPGTLWREPQILERQMIKGDPYELLLFTTLLRSYPRGKQWGPQLFAGQPDPQDESRFTVAGRIAGLDFQILGQLLPDDTVRIECPSAGALNNEVFRRIERGD